MKQVWVNFSACSWMAWTTFGWEWPTFMTAMPPAKSMYSLPSMSQRSAPSPRSM